MKVVFSPTATKRYKKFSLALQKKIDKQLMFLLTNYRHPSLRSRKMSEEIYEVRIDYHYRFTFRIEEDTIQILTIGPHDEGLGKK